MPRDTQRQRVYDAERMLPPSPIGTGSMQEVVDYTASVVGSAWWRKRSRVRTVQVKDGRGRRNACAYGNTINLPRWARSKKVVLHELAHILSDSEGVPALLTPSTVHLTCGVTSRTRSANSGC